VGRPELEVTGTEGILAPSSLFLTPAEQGAERLLHRFAARHPGVSLVTPSTSREPWRALVDADANPDDSREAIFTARQPSELLAKLDAEFPRPGLA
jgi:hypothetical protein